MHFPTVIQRWFVCYLFALIALFALATHSPAEEKTYSNEIEMPMKVMASLLKSYAEQNGNQYPDRVQMLCEKGWVSAEAIAAIKDYQYVGKGLTLKDEVPAEQKQTKANILILAMNAAKSHYTIVYVDGSHSSHENQKGFKTSEEVYKSFK